MDYENFCPKTKHLKKQQFQNNFGVVLTNFDLFIVVWILKTLEFYHNYLYTKVTIEILSVMLSYDHW